MAAASRDSGFAHGLSAAVKDWMNRQDECTIAGISTPALSQASQSSHGGIVNLTRGTEHQGDARIRRVHEQRSFFFSLLWPRVCVICGFRLSHKLQFWQGRRPQLEAWQASSPRFVRRWRRDQFVQLRDDREAGPTMCLDKREDIVLSALSGVEHDERNEPLVVYDLIGTSLFT